MLLDGNEIDATADGLFLNNNTAQNVILANGGGNVGISTEVPLRNLHIRDVMRLEPRTTFPSDSAAGDIFVLGMGDANALCFYTGTAWVTAAQSNLTCTSVD